tara:strand:- start:967 stop:1638 length:672 start_codon:yes stop_codon:yes gene_type:complete
MTVDSGTAAELRSAFAQDGYVVVRDFVPEPVLAEIRARAAEVVRSQPNAGGKFTNVTKGLEKSDHYFDDLLNSGSHVPVLEMLMGRKPEPTTASFFTKSEHREQIHPHADALEGGVIWIALDEANRENGCLHFLKGSHLRQEEFSHLDAGTPTDLSDHPDAVEIRMSPGDIVFFRPNTVHWSGPNQSGTERRGFNCFYVGDPFRHLTEEQRIALKKKRQQASA